MRLQRYGQLFSINIFYVYQVMPSRNFLQDFKSDRNAKSIKESKSQSDGLYHVGIDNGAYRGARTSYNAALL